MCVCVFQCNFNFGRDSFKMDNFLNLNTKIYSFYIHFTSYDLHASHNILIFIGQHENYC